MKSFILRAIDSLILSPPLGLDISERSVKYISFGNGSLFTVDAYGEIEVPEGIIEHAEIKKEREFSEIFRTWRMSQPRRIQSARVIASVPEEKSFVRVIQLPKIEKENIAQAVRWELEANVPIPQDQLIYDYEIIEPIENHLNHVDVAITAYPKAIVDSYVRVLKGADFAVAALELESQAIVRACIPGESASKAYLVVDMGRYRSSFVIFSGGAIRFTATIPLGGKTIEENIVKELGVSSEEALTIKKTIGLDKKAFEGKLFSAFIPALSALADELRRAIFFYQDHAAHTHGAESIISSLLLSGGDANLYGLDTYLSSALKLPVYTADPFAAFRRVSANMIPPIPPNTALAFTTAIGLALRG